ncbi:MAG: hypothetical protein ACD_39C01819G0005 [uncultured bacterium]|nr:MAG: hypothetical protein ACD_39C01819G0005 [uncultured bacterium]
MDDIKPFSQEDLNEIFKLSTTNIDRVISRESSNLEFKESFGWVSLAKYLKTCAAYANTKGGYIVFGIANRPHLLCGLSGANLKSFDEIDPEKMSGHFNEHFAPEIQWDIQEYELKGKIFGLLYIHEARDKPVVCIKDAGKELKEGDIYYRYRGRSERIKYPELRAILELKRENEQRIWMHHLGAIARIGVRDAGIFDLNTGSVTGTSGAFLIEESLLSQLSFIKEGEFSEVKGKPALKLLGHLEPMTGALLGSSKKQIVKTKGIRTADIVLGFLNKDNVHEPEEYLKQICFESTAFLPVHFFIRKSGLDSTQAIEVLENIVSRSTTRTKLIERLKNKNTQQVMLSESLTDSATKKRKYAEGLKKNSINADLSDKELEYCLQGLRSLSSKEIKSNSSYIRKLLKIWFNKYYASAKGTLADNLRRAICWVDEALNV